MGARPCPNVPRQALGGGFTLVEVLVALGIVAIALMCFSYVLIDWLTPGRLGELLLSGNSAVVWVNVVVFVTLGVSVGATL